MRRAKILSIVFFVVAVGLLAGAIYTVSLQKDLLKQAWEAARHASRPLLITCALLPLMNWLSTTATLWVLTGKYGRVRPVEMGALIGAAWLLNLLPARPGTIGRAAYHKKFNGIAVTDSVRVLVIAMICTAIALGVLLLAVAVAGRISEMVPTWICLAVPPAVFGGVAFALRRKEHAWRWPAAVGCRYFDMVTWLVRYVLVFELIGHPIGLTSGGALAATGQIAMLAPVQFGLREWAVGLASTLLPETSATGLSTAAPGLLADGVMRASELLIVVPLGLAASVWLWRRARNFKEEEATEPKSAPADAQQPKTEP